MIEIKQYRDKWLAEKVDEFIGFYTREFFCLDNFSSFGIMYNGIYYQTVEHAYQSLKFKDTAPEVEKEIINSYSAHEAKIIATENKDKQVKNWDDIKITVMEALLRVKLEQNPYVKQKLLQTKNYLICEDSPKDSFWGIGANRDGRNELGKLWMKLREELKIMGSETSGLLFTKNKDGSIKIEVIYYDWAGKDCDYDQWYDLDKENADKLYAELCKLHSGTFEEMLITEFGETLDMPKFKRFCRDYDIKYSEMSWTNLG